ncbi:hypothetical protein T440DRAFT_514766 [Plenodomus tracheiphilus IPT5]|uniref:F-box domain-containing protein n=1 Tax=Plenodomus tracheiphilus IPT5 TaxID=1408161 RepID=A0A6A7BF32_9PLEO|nr:hypothetical protein T440DRAFT_514766 [Plenodomus tracheiphilus IPT5]
MYLLDLPPEIFENIIHELVSAGILAALRLCTVCRTFADGIAHDVLANRKIAEFGSSTISPFLARHLATFLSNKAKCPLDADSTLLHKINEMGRFLVDNLKLEDGLRTEKMMMTLRHKIANRTGKRATLMLLQGVWPLTNGSLQDLMQPLTPLQKICVAIAVDAQELVPRLLRRSRGSLVDDDFLSSPVELAVADGSRKCYRLSWTS